jgi:hypothetical protein
MAAWIYNPLFGKGLNAPNPGRGYAFHTLSPKGSVDPLMRAKPRLGGPISRIDQEHEGERDAHEELGEEHNEHIENTHQPATIRFTLGNPNHCPDRISRGKDTRLNPQEKNRYTIGRVTRVRERGRITSIKEQSYEECLDTI